ncbi:MAG: hypothetical protein AAF211_03005 [Myxococcota bacterium]
MIAAIGIWWRLSMVGIRIPVAGSRAVKSHAVTERRTQGRAELNEPDFDLLGVPA